MRILLCILSLISFTACFRTNYYTVSSAHLDKNEKRELIAENDSLKVIYNFSGIKGRLGITIYNKTDQPVEINWAKSSLIVGDKIYSYFKPQMTLQGTVTSASGSGAVEGKVHVNQEIQFLPPDAKVSRVPIHVLTSPIPLPDFKNQHTEVFRGKNQTKIKLFKVFYGEETSPRKFRSLSQ